LGDGELAYEALYALARSPAPNAADLIASILPTPLSRLAMRAYVMRTLLRGERRSAADDLIARLATAESATDRAMASFARVALGDVEVSSLIDDKDARIRRAAAMGAMARPFSKRIERALLERLVKESDSVTRQVLAAGLLNGDPDGLIKTTTL